MVVEVTCWLRLGDVKKAEQPEGGGLPEKGVRRHEQNQPEGDDFVPHNTAMVWVAQRPAGPVDGPDAEYVGSGKQPEQREIGEIGMEQVEAQPREQGAEGAGRPWGQAAATAAGEKVRRMGE